LPEPDRPVNTTSLSRGISRSTFLRLCSRAPRIVIARRLAPAVDLRLALMTSSIGSSGHHVGRKSCAVSGKRNEGSPVARYEAGLYLPERRKNAGGFPVPWARHQPFAV